jgi:dihydroorotase|tara:strand:- start:735 stop:2072 length:1338 start_codon:yes stop_codon:yes gene_type:complete
MNKKLICNGIIVNEGFQSQNDILIEGDKIIEIKPNINPKPDIEVIDAKGLYILPGLIDDQVHFREPGLTHKGTIESESKAAVAGGITSFIEMPNTIPQTTTKIDLDKKFQIASKTSAANFSFLFGGTNENIDEILKLDKKQVAGIKLFLGSSTGNMLVDDPEVLRKIFSSTDLLISVHCEDEKTIKHNLDKYIKKYGQNIPISKHPIIRSEQACYISSSKAISLAKETGARLHVFHISTGKETELFDNKIELKDKKITSEVCVHHLWFTDDDYDEKGTLIKWNPAIKSKSDQIELWKALNDDRIDVIASDHAPHTKAEKNNSYLKAPSGGPLVQHSLLALLSSVKRGKISLEKLVQKACHNPAILFEINKRGYLREGYYADFVIVNLNTKTKVTKDSLLYKCEWSPFEGVTFDAKIEKTFVNGIKVYDNGVILKTDAGKQLTFNR